MDFSYQFLGRKKKMIDVTSLSLDELRVFLDEMGEKHFRAKQIYEWIHKRLATSYVEMSNIPLTLRNELETRLPFPKIETVLKRTSKSGDTTKFVFKLFDGYVIESVLMEHKYGNSVCISSQVGCRMGCKFCASTLLGLTRNLTSGEMLTEVYKIQRELGKRIDNIVVMGTGEPLDNYDNLVKFITQVSNPMGLNISQRNITVSTCGIVDKIRELATEKLGITLAISLHSPSDEERRKIMPIANKYSIGEILSATDFYFNTTKRRISFEYALIEGENDNIEDAQKLIKLLKKRNCHLNLIPINPIKERNYKKTRPKRVMVFKNILETAGINVTVREEMGADIDAACGQLRKEYIDDKREENGV